MKVVGLVGPKRSGKDTAAAALVEQRGYVRVGFADALKELALRINPNISSFGWGTRLADVVGGHGWEKAKGHSEVRRFLQELGTGVRDIVGEDTWLRVFHRTVRERYWDQVPGVVVPDVRFLNEARELCSWGSTLLIRIERPGSDTSDAHISETEQVGIECDVTIVNDGTPEQLHAKVLAAVDEHL